MGRRAKYATLSKYRPYIDIIRRDLNIPDNVIVKVTFNPLRRIGGSAWYDGVTYRIRISKFSNHSYVIISLMHEFRHIYQRITGKYVAKSEKDVLWNNTPYKLQNVSKNKKKHQQYLNSPWEIDARNYQDQALRLFPNYQLPDTRVCVGTIGKSTYYKVTHGENN